MNPYQGLKLRRKESVKASIPVLINMNPYQGLKLQVRNSGDVAHQVLINMNPYQGLKQIDFFLLVVYKKF